MLVRGVKYFMCIYSVAAGINYTVQAFQSIVSEIKQNLDT